MTTRIHADTWLLIQPRKGEDINELLGFLADTKVQVQDAYESEIFPGAYQCHISYTAKGANEFDITREVDAFGSDRFRYIVIRTDIVHA